MSLEGDQVGPLLLTRESMLLGAFVLVMGWLVAAYSARNLRGQRHQGRFAALLAAAIVSLWLVVVAEPFALMALGWTVSGLSVAGLVAHSGTPAARRASRRIAGRLLIGDAALWTAVALLYGQGMTGRSDMGAAGWAVPALLASAGVVRSALLPAWRWLPLTAEAPSPVSALLHAGVVNGLGLLAVLLWPMFAAAPGVLLALIVVGAATAIAGTAAMRVRPDVKGKLASSTSAQMGYMAVQVGLGLPAFAMLHLIGHGFYKGWLFLRAGGASRRTAPDFGSAPRWAVMPLALLPAAIGGWAMVQSRPVVDLVPLLVAGAAAGCAVAALIWPDRRTAAHSTSRGRAWSVVLVLAGLVFYVTVLGLWGKVFEEPGVWSGTQATVLIAAVIVVGLSGMLAVSKGWLRRLVLPVVVDTALAVRGRVSPLTPKPAPSADIAIEVAARTVGAMWPLHSAVAVNPLSGMQDMAFDDAVEIAGSTWCARGHLTEQQYAQAMAAGRFTPADLVAAAEGFSRPAEQIAQYLQRRAHWRPDRHKLSAAERLLADLGDEQVAGLLPDERPRPSTLGEQCGAQARVSGLANAWTAVANQGLPMAGDLWAQFRSDVQDLGLRGLRVAVRALPADPSKAVGALLAGVVPRAEQVGYLSRLLARDPGWAAHLSQRDAALVADLLAIRMTFDVFVSAARGHWAWVTPRGRDARRRAIEQAAPVIDLLDADDAQEALLLADELCESARVRVWQRALEQRYRNRLIDRVSARSAQGARTGSPQVQAIFCIDVRSERYRRHLEAMGEVATYGFAGFFGIPMQVRTASGMVSDQCPVLLRPSHVVEEQDGPAALGVPAAMRGSLVTATARPGTAFAVAEGLGIVAGLDALVQTAAPGLWGRLRDAVIERPRGQVQMGMSVRQRTASAAGMLRALGMVDGFAPTILIAGHAATVENNAFAAAYDCGACGGRGGHINARVMAAILNDAQVRRLLSREYGITIPDTTVALPAWHNTTTDEVTIDPQDVPASHAAATQSMRVMLRAAGRGCVAERLAELPDGGRPTAARAARRASDWAEPQPEWGLAGNAAFVIGPRAMTEGLNLRGRVFLHSYEPGLDVDGSTLELLLTAPMVVTQWINNQYYFSTVDPDRFGAGDKTTHNVVGDYGVFSGVGGDLRVGLPWQAVFRDQPGPAARWMHEPLRLQVVVYAGRENIIDVLSAHADVAALVANEWIALAAIEPATGEAYALGADLRWRAWLETNRSDAGVHVMKGEG